MAFVPTDVSDFSGGIYRGRKAPPGTVYDLLNGLINDEGLPFRRGGSAYKSDADAGGALDMLADSYTAAGRRTFFSSEADSHVWVLDPDDDASPVQLGGIFGVRSQSRPAASSGAVFFPSGPGAAYAVRAYAGSLMESSEAASVSVTEGSPTVTGSGTSWLTAIDPGTFVIIEGDTSTYVVRSVESDTELNLFTPWAAATDASAFLGAGGSFLSVAVGADYGVDSNAGVYVTSVGTGQRLIVAVRQRAFISDRNDPFTFRASSYLEIPSDSEIVGANSMRDNGVLWTTGGVWLLSQLDLDPVDAYGNVQWQQQQISKDVILWGDPGVAAWSGAFVVPALDDVYIFSLDGQAAPISASIRPLYRDHVQAGRTPGTAAVFKGHYLLPILEEGDVVDTLVCRLDRDAAWTRWAGHAAGPAYALRSSSTGEPMLLGLAGERVTDLTGCFNPGEDNTADADGTTSDFELVTSDLPTGRNQPGFVDRLRARYELESATIEIDAGTTDPFTTLSGYSQWFDVSGGLLVHSSGTVKVAEDPFFGTSGYGSMVRNVVLGPNQYSQIDLTTAFSNTSLDVFGCGVRLGGGFSGNLGGYSLALEPEPETGGLKLRICLEPDRTTIATSATVNYASVQAIRLVAFATTLIGQIKIGGVWSDAVTATDGTYGDDGQPGLYAGSFGGSNPGITSFTWGEVNGSAIAVEYSSDQDDGVFTLLTEVGEQGGGEGWGNSNGSLYQWAKVGRRRSGIRFRLRLSGASSNFVLKGLEMLTRPSGKQ